LNVFQASAVQRGRHGGSGGNDPPGRSKPHGASWMHHEPENTVSAHTRRTRPAVSDRASHSGQGETRLDQAGIRRGTRPQPDGEARRQLSRAAFAHALHQKRCMEKRAHCGGQSSEYGYVAEAQGSPSARRVLSGRYDQFDLGPDGPQGVPAGPPELAVAELALQIDEHQQLHLGSGNRKPSHTPDNGGSAATVGTSVH